MLKTNQLSGLLAGLFGWRIELLLIVTCVLEETNYFCDVIVAQFVA